jgi:hypothetical protein
MKNYFPFRVVRNPVFSIKSIFPFTCATLIEIKNEFGSDMMIARLSTFNQSLEISSQELQYGIFLPGTCHLDISSGDRDTNESTHSRVKPNQACATQ